MSFPFAFRDQVCGGTWVGSPMLAIPLAEGISSRSGAGSLCVSEAAQVCFQCSSNIPGFLYLLNIMKY